VAVVVKEIIAAGGEAEGFDVDVSDPAAVKALVAGVVERFGGVDILINNAGVSIPASAAEASDEEFDTAWQRTMAVNLTAQARLGRAPVGSRWLRVRPAHRGGDGGRPGGVSGASCAPGRVVATRTNVGARRSPHPASPSERLSARLLGRSVLARHAGALRRR